MSPDRTPGSEAQIKHRNKKLEIIREYKSSRGCEKCDEDDWVALDLHHLDPATKNPKLTFKTNNYRRGGGGFWQRLSLTELTEEFEKCSVLCANCHRKETYRLYHQEKELRNGKC